MFSAYSSLVKDAKRLCTEAAPGPWLVNDKAFSLTSQVQLQVDGKMKVRRLKIATFRQTTDLAVMGGDDNPTLRLICTAPEIIPELIAAIEDLDGQLERAYAALGLIASQEKKHEPV